MVIKKNEVFAPFGDFGFSDYVISLPFTADAKKFTIDRYTAGDLKRSVNIPAPLSEKVFKNIIRINSQPSASALNQQPTQPINNVNESYYEESTTTINNENTKTENFITEGDNIQSIIQNQINKSNNYTIEQIQELEVNLQELKKENNYFTINNIKNVEEKILQETNKTKKEFKEELDRQKQFFDRFINS